MSYTDSYESTEQARVYEYFTTLTHCPRCKRDLGESLLPPPVDGVHWVDRAQISGAWAFHIYDSHGLPLELFGMLVNEKVGMKFPLDSEGNSVNK